MAQAQLAKEGEQASDDEEEAVAEPVTVARLGALLQKMSQGGMMPAEVGGWLCCFYV